MKGSYFRPVECLEEGLNPGPTTPDPALQMSTLAQPWGTRKGRQFADCKRCWVARACAESVLELGPFADPECEKALMNLLAPRSKFYTAVVPVLKAHPDEGLTVGEVKALAGLQDAPGMVDALKTLERHGQVRIDRSNPNIFRYFWTGG